MHIYSLNVLSIGRNIKDNIVIYHSRTYDTKFPVNTQDWHYSGELVPLPLSTFYDSRLDISLPQAMAALFVGPSHKMYYG